MESERQITPVAAAVIRRGDAYLVCRRPVHKRHGGLWEFPGGKLEESESFVSAMTRELAEELGVLVIRVGEVLFSHHDPGSPYRVYFHSVEIDGEPVPLEHSELAWLPITELRKLQFAPTDELFVRLLLEQAR